MEIILIHKVYICVSEVRRIDIFRIYSLFFVLNLCDTCYSLQCEKNPLFYRLLKNLDMKELSDTPDMNYSLVNYYISLDINTRF